MLSSWRGGGPGEGSEATGADRAAPRWLLPAAIAGVGAAALIALFWGVGEAIVHTWTTSRSYGHGYLIGPICAYLLWRRRVELAQMWPTPSLWGLAAMAVAAVVWLLGESAGVLVVKQFAFIAMFQALFLAVFGVEVVRRTLFALLYMYFAVPFGDFMVGPLQDYTAQFVVRALQLNGISVFLDGVFIQIPSGNFIVAEACAGVRFLTVSVALGFLVAHLFYQQWWRRALFIALSVAVPIAANGVRAYGIVIIAHLTDHKVAVGVDHIVYGFVFLGIVTFCLLALGLTFREDDQQEEGLGAAEPVPPRPVAWVMFAVAAAGELLVAGAAQAYARYTDPDVAGGAQVILRAPDVRSPWALDTGPGTWRPSFRGADAELIQGYAAGDRRVDYFVAYYRRQRQGAEIVSWHNRTADEEAWLRAGSGQRTAVVEGAPMTVAYTRMLSNTTGRVAWH